MNVVWLLLAFVLLFALFVVSRARVYGRLFGDEHFIELGRGLATVRAAAIERIIDEGSEKPPSRGDPRALLTSSGLLVVYTVSKRGAAFVHHCSVGATRSVTAHAVGETFVLFVAKVLRLPIEKMAFQIADSTVHHGEAVLDEAAHRALVSTTIIVVTETNVADLRRQAMEAREGIRWH